MPEADEQKLCAAIPKIIGPQYRLITGQMCVVSLYVMNVLNHRRPAERLRAKATIAPQELP